MASAGLVSTYWLFTLLQAGNETLLAHHVVLAQPSRRHVVEAERCAAIIGWCQTNLRPFHFSSTTIDHGALQRTALDLAVLGFEAGLVCQSYRLQDGRRLDRWLLGEAPGARQDPALLRPAIACAAANSFPSEAPPLELLPPMMRDRAWQALPPPLRDFVWSCETPLWPDAQPVACGHCPGCRRAARER